MWSTGGFEKLFTLCTKECYLKTNKQTNLSLKEWSHPKNLAGKKQFKVFKSKTDSTKSSIPFLFQAVFTLGAKTTGGPQRGIKLVFYQSHQVWHVRSRNAKTLVGVGYWAGETEKIVFFFFLATNFLTSSSLGSNSIKEIRDRKIK